MLQARSSLATCFSLHKSNRNTAAFMLITKSCFKFMPHSSPFSQKGPADLMSWHVNRDQFTHQKSAATSRVRHGSCLALQENEDCCVKLKPQRKQGDERMCSGWKTSAMMGVNAGTRVWKSSGGKLEMHRQNMLLLLVWKVGHIQHCKWETDSSLTQRIGFFLLCHYNFFEYQEVHSPTDYFTRVCFCTLWLCAQIFFRHGVTTDPCWLPQTSHHIQFFKI